ncbi:O-antigen ligase family protein [Marinobacter nauticus]
MACPVLNRKNAVSLTLFGISLLIMCVVLFSDFFYLKDLKRLDLQRVLLCTGLVVAMIFHAGFYLLRPKFIFVSGHLTWFFPFFFVLLGHYLYFDIYGFFPFEGLMFLLFFGGIALNGGLICQAVGVVNASKILVAAIVISCGFYAALTIIRYTFILSDGVSIKNLIPWGFVNIRLWSHVATLVVPLFPLAVLVGPFRHQRIWRLIALFTASVWWWIVIVSSAHGSMISVAIGAALAVLFFGKESFLWAKKFTNYLVGGFVLWLLLSWVVPEIFLDRAGEIPGDVISSTPVRLLMWEEAYAMSLVNFPFGMGGQAWLMHEPLTQPYIEGSVRPFGAPHNMYLLWAAEYGWISVLALFLPFGYSIYRLSQVRSSMRSHGEKDNAIIVAVTASMVAVIVHSGVSSVLLAAPGMLVAFMVFSLYWAIIASQDGLAFTNDNFKSNFGSYFRFNSALRAIFAIVFFAAVWLGALFLKEVRDYHGAMQSNWECFPEETKLGPIPRFWEHGYFPNPLNYKCD